MAGYVNPQTGIPSAMPLSAMMNPSMGRFGAGGFGGLGGPLGSAMQFGSPAFAAPQAPGGGRMPMDSFDQSSVGPGGLASSMIAHGGGGSPPFFPGGDRAPQPFPALPGGEPSPPFNPGGGGFPIDPGGRIFPAPPGGGGVPPPGGSNPGPMSGSFAWSGPPTPVPEMSFSPGMNWQTYGSLTPEQQQHPAWQNFIRYNPRPGGVESGGQNPQEVADYWTPERMRNAGTLGMGRIAGPGGGSPPFYPGGGGVGGSPPFNPPIDRAPQPFPADRFMRRSPWGSRRGSVGIGSY